MKIIERYLNDILLLKPDVWPDSIGDTFSYGLRELYDVGITCPFVQANYSYSAVNVVRGLHYQIEHPQGKLIRVLLGCIFDVAVDLRRSSRSFGQQVSFRLSATDYFLLWIPLGYAHGFMVLEGPVGVVYSVTDYRYADHERTLLWCDLHLAINWPAIQSDPILSDKDQCGTPFAQCEYYP